MVKNALGLIETVGLAAAIEAADAAVKAANICLIGYELTKGGGMVVVKLSGDVGAIKAAVAAGATAASKVGKVWATHVIPRLHQQTAGVVATRETIGQQNKNTASAPLAAEQTAGAAPVAGETPGATTDDGTCGLENSTGGQAAVLLQPAIEQEEQHDETSLTETQKKSADICNLCGDPACPRKKGDPKVTCMHWEKNNKEDE